MTDVRLTALNPVDSQVYPVACNDKGELLLESNESTGNLNVQGDLTVTGTGTFVNGSAEIQSQGFFVGTGFVSYKMAASSYAIHDDDVNWKYSVYYDGTTHIGGYITTVDPANDSPNIALRADGSANFAGLLTVNTTTGGNNVASFESSGNNSYGIKVKAGGASAANYFADFRKQDNSSVFKIDGNGEATFAGNGHFGGDFDTENEAGVLIGFGGKVSCSRFTGTSEIWRGREASSLTATSTILADGSATFAGSVTSNASVSNFNAAGTLTNGGAKVRSYDSGTGSSTKYHFYADCVNGNIIKLATDGSASFSGPVTAPNITFRLSEQAVAEMPVPLIDEGFATNREIDLLRELIKMKAEIRDLNAFMQKSIQENPEIEQ
tara:strand:- start:392 stop:1531 length:1140 start_codon:yes stop_codon:yes gene_type:complete